MILFGSITLNSYSQDFRVTPLQLKQTNILFNKLEYLENINSCNDSIIKLYNSKDSLYQVKDSILTDSLSTLNKDFNKVNKKYNTSKKIIFGESILAIILCAIVLI